MIPASIRNHLKQKYPTAAHHEGTREYFVKTPDGQCLVAIHSDAHGFKDGQKDFNARDALDLSPLPNNCMETVVGKGDALLKNKSFCKKTRDKILQEGVAGRVPALAALDDEEHEEFGEYSCKKAGADAVYGEETERVSVSRADQIARKKAELAALELEHDDGEEEEDEEPAPVKRPAKKNGKRK